MKDEEKAEEYYYKTYPVTLNIGEEERKKEVTDIFLAGLKAGRPQWHDLRKDKNDLPKYEKDVQVLYQDGDKVNTYTCLYDIHGGFWLYYNLDSLLLERFDYHVIAWCEIPTFDKE